MTTPAADLEQLRSFLRQHHSLVVLTGAGVSVESGIPTYRDAQGTWQRNKPIQHAQFVEQPQMRQRYWARSMLGWHAVGDARPNQAHLALARLEQQGRVKLLITQNVDRLHQRAGSQRVVDLHGRLDRVRCLSCGQLFPRESFQHRLQLHNPQVQTAAASLQPDGDADVPDQLVAGMDVPACEHCAGVLTPDVVFFGGSVPGERVARCMAAVDEADALVAIGSSLQVYSGFRFCRRAVQSKRPLLIINPGNTRADDLATLKIESACGPLLWAGTGGAAQG